MKIKSRPGNISPTCGPPRGELVDISLHLLLGKPDLRERCPQLVIQTIDVRWYCIVLIQSDRNSFETVHFSYSSFINICSQMIQRDFQNAA